MSLRNPNLVNTRAPKRVAIVISNPARSTTTGWPVGFWWSELAHPYYEFRERGHQVAVFSPRGGRCEADALSDPRDASGYSETDLLSLGFLTKHAALVEDTRPIDQLRVETSTRWWWLAARRRCSRSRPSMPCSSASRSSTRQAR